MDKLAKRFPLRRLIIFGVVGLLVVLVGLGFWFDPFGLRSARGEGRPREKVVDDKPLAVELAPHDPNSLEVPLDVQESLGIRRGKHFAVVAVEPPKHGHPLVMPASTDLDPATVGRVRSRFNAEVIKLGKGEPNPFTGESEPELRAGDQVKKDQVLAVVWSADVAAKKSDLVEALVQLALDEARLKTREALAKEGGIPLDLLEQTRRDVAVDRSTASRAERNLRIWRIPPEEIKAVHDEAKEILRRGGERDPKKEEEWSRSEILAPRGGTLVECNVTVREYIADNTANLFVIADVDRLLVRGNLPEDDLPRLLSLPREGKTWTVSAVGLKEPQQSRITNISFILDPNQHTAVVTGYLDNPKQVLRAGQFVSATVQMPPPEGAVEVPVSAVVDEHVFVQTGPARFTLRRVDVTQRFEKTVFVRFNGAPGLLAGGTGFRAADARPLTKEEKERDMLPVRSLLPGERVLTTGVLELKARLEDLRSGGQ